jgi:hypothetical protein
MPDYDTRLLTAEDIALLDDILPDWREREPEELRAAMRGHLDSILDLMNDLRPPPGSE